MSIGEWRRGPTVGCGSSATVSLASASSSGEVFAVKSVELSRSGLLQREQRILSSLNCPNIVSFLGYDITAETPIQRLYYNLFIEYAPGGSLSDHIKKQGGRLDELAIRSHTHEILCGLSYLHSQRLTHCDIKGQNILIGSDGRAKIADFGCARWIAGTDDDHREHPMSGTPMFMAPEVARGEEQGPAADVWALGCTVIEMATGKPPWPDVSDPITALHRIAFSSDLPASPSWVSDEGKDFLSKCLKRDPKERWTADQLIKHPFVVLQENSIKKNLKWASPRSTLDQDLWESMSQEDELEEDPSNDPKQRIRQLDGSSHGGPSWSWDESWVTIRSNSGECSIIPKPEDAMVEISEDRRDVLTSIISASSIEDMEDFFSNSNDPSSSNNNDWGVVSVSEARAEGNEREMQLSCCTRDLISFPNRTEDSGNHKHCILFALSECCLDLLLVASFLLSHSFLFLLCLQMGGLLDGHMLSVSMDAIRHGDEVPK